MKRIIFGAMASVLMFVGAADAGILVGTVQEPTNPTILKINQLIADYNTDFGASLAAVDELLDKIEGDDSADFTEGNLFLSNFNFFKQSNDSPTTSLNIFDTTVNFKPSSLASIGFNGVDSAVQGFEQVSGTSFEYYTSKDGVNGWSLWTYMDGLNPVYTDSINGGFTRGEISDNSLAYDPIVNAVSNIRFYTADDLPEDPEEVIPEPATMAIWGMLTGFGALFGYRKRKLATATA